MEKTKKRKISSTAQLYSGYSTSADWSIAYVWYTIRLRTRKMVGLDFTILRLTVSLRDFGKRRIYHEATSFFSLWYESLQWAFEIAREVPDMPPPVRFASWTEETREVGGSCRIIKPCNVRKKDNSKTIRSQMVDVMERI